MRAVINRVNWAKVTVAGKTVGEIQKGFLIFLGIKKGDSLLDLNYLLEKISTLRILIDEKGAMNLPPRPEKESFLVISQFTLYGDVRRGKRPSFDQAANANEAIPFYQTFLEGLRKKGFTVACGEFGADMKVQSENDGPITILLDSEKIF